MDELKQQYEGKVEFQTVDVGDHQVFNRYHLKYDLQVVPTVIVLDGSGKVVLNEAGIMDEASYKSKLAGALGKVSGQP